MVMVEHGASSLVSISFESKDLSPAKHASPNDLHKLSIDHSLNGHIAFAPGLTASDALGVPFHTNQMADTHSEAKLLENNGNHVCPELPLNDQTNRAAPTSTESMPSSCNLSSGPPATSDTGDADLSSTKKSKVKKMLKTSKTTKAKAKRSANYKRSHSDSSSNEDDQSSDSEEEETDLPTSLKGGCKKTIKSKNSKRPKAEIATENAENGEGDAEASDSDLEETHKKKTKSPKRNVRAKTNKQNNKKTKSPKQPTKGGKVKSKKIVESDEDSDDDDDDDEEGANVTDREDELDLNMTDEADEEEEIGHEIGDQQQQNSKKSKSAKANKSKEMKVSNKSVRPNKHPKPNKSKNLKIEKLRKSDKSEKASKPSAKCDQSDDDTEQSEDDIPSVKEPTDQDKPQYQTNQKSKCDKSKSINGPDCLSKGNFTNGCSQVKDVYTFELSPGELAPSATTRFVLSSGQENKSRAEGGKGETTEQCPVDSTPVTDNPSSVANLPPNSVPIKTSFSPKILVNGQDGKEDTVYEPLRPDTYSHFEPSFGPNSSLSSLSQLSQSIGGGSGPIMLNHQSPTKCQMNIKEEPKDEQSLFRSLPNSKASIHRTSSPVIADHPSQNYGANFVSSHKNVHPRRLWSNASAGSLISSSSSSSSSPVHLAFGQCPPTPATPASLASYFTPSPHLPALTPSLYPSPQNQELIRRELDSRILASAVNERNLLSSSLGIPPPTGPFAPIPTPIAFNHISSSALLPPSSSALIYSSASSFIPSVNTSPFYSINSLNASPFMSGINMPFRPVSNLTNVNLTSVSSNPTATVTSLAASSSTTTSKPNVKPKLVDVKKGLWGSMHVQIATNIYQKQREKVDHKSASITSSLAKTSSHSKSSKSSSSSTRLSEPPNTVNQQSSSKSSSMKNSLDSVSTPPSTVRPASATTFNANYPARYGAPFGTSSISAPPILPGLFPPTIPSPMHLSGFMPDSWPRPTIPVSLPAPMPNTSRTSGIYPDYYASVNSASSALSAWAAGIRPPGGESITPNKQSSDNHRPQSSSSSSQKRKHDDIESHSKSSHRTSSSKHSNSSSTPYQNGDIRNELPTNKKPHSSSSHKSSHRSDYAGSSHRTVLENGERSRMEFHGESSRSKMLFEPRQDHRYPSFTMANSNVSPSTSFAGAMFGTSHTFPSTSDHQRYLELLSMSMSSTLPPPPAPAINSFISARSNNVDLSSRPLWPYGMPPPPTPSSSVMAAAAAAAASSMMPDPFKSLQDISLRPGLVTPDRETLFSRYSLLNSSGGGASIFDKLNKEQLEKFEMLQNQNKVSQSHQAPKASSSNSKSSSHSESSMSSSSRSTPTQRFPPPPPPPTSLSSALPAPSTPFPYPSPYLNPLHHLTAPGSSYLPQPLSHPSFVPNSAMLNGVDSLSKLALGHPGSVPYPPGLSGDCPPSSQFMLPPHYPTGPGPSMVNFMKPSSASPAHFNHSTR